MPISLDDIIEFMYSGNKTWQNINFKKEILKEFLEKAHVDFGFIAEQDKLKIVAVYLKNKICIHFISLTIKSENGSFYLRKLLKEIIEKEKPKFYSWMSPDYRIISREA